MSEEGFVAGDLADLGEGGGEGLAEVLGLLAEGFGGELVTIVGGLAEALLGFEVAKLVGEIAVLGVEVGVGLLELAEVGPIPLEGFAEATGTALFNGEGGLLQVADFGEGIGGTTGEIGGFGQFCSKTSHTQTPRPSVSTGAFHSLYLTQVERFFHPPNN